MREHSIEELDRQVQAAKEKHRLATLALNQANERLKLAKVKATGLYGHKVSFFQSSWRMKEPTEYVFVVDAIAMWGSEVEGFMVKKDGSLGSIRKRAAIKSVKDLGPYEPASPAGDQNGK